MPPAGSDVWGAPAGSGWGTPFALAEPIVIMATRTVHVRMMFGSLVKDASGPSFDRQIEVKADGSDSLHAVKEQIAVRGVCW